MTITIENGELRCVLSEEDEAHEVCSILDEPVQRAGSIEPVTEGPKRGWWYVDFSALAGPTADPQFAVCLARTFANRREARDAEAKWLEDNFLGLEAD